jgi:hypothetical protein
MMMIMLDYWSARITYTRIYSIPQPQHNYNHHPSSHTLLSPRSFLHCHLYLYLTGYEPGLCTVTLIRLFASIFAQPKVIFPHFCAFSPLVGHVTRNHTILSVSVHFILHLCIRTLNLDPRRPSKPQLIQKTSHLAWILIKSLPRLTHPLQQVTKLTHLLQQAPAYASTATSTSLRIYCNKHPLTHLLHKCR